MVTPTASGQLMFSINDLDNIERTTQLKMLPSRWGIQKMKDIHEYHSKLTTLMKTNALQEWWFGTDDKDFVETIRSALKSRRKCATQSPHPAVFDRGATMLKAVCIARIALLNGVDVVSAEEVFTGLTKEPGTEWPEEDHAILIDYEGTTEQNMTGPLNLAGDADDKYKTAYEVLLHQALDRQAKNGSYSVIISRSGKNCLEVHEEICEWLRNIGMPKSWSLLLSTVSCIVGFGGLSESGKSTVAMATSAHFGDEGIRLKIIYFMGLASRELKSNIYDLPNDEQAFWLIQEIDRFAAAHKWLNVICIDSLHNFDFSQALRHVLDGKSLFVYMDTEESTRFSRVNISNEEFIKKDETKIMRGADRIKEISDIVADNNGRFEDTVAHVTGAVQAHVLQHSLR